jgi:hypothetical protein
MVSVVVIITFTLLVSTQAFILSGISGLLILAGIFLVGLNLKKQPTLAVIITLSGLTIYIGFSYYLKMDRDYAAYMINAAYLVRNGSFFSETQYIPWGMDVNNGLQTPSFLFGYSVYLTPFIRIFGELGYFLANSTLLIISILSLQNIVSYIKPSLASKKFLWLIFLFSPIVIWLYSYTYSETMFLPFVWGAIVIFLESKKRMSWIGILVSFVAVTLAFTVRIEAVGLMGTFALGIHVLYARWKIGWKRYIIAVIIALLVSISTLLCVLHLSGNYIQSQVGGVAPVADVAHSESTISDFIERQQLLFFSFGTYLVLFPLIWGLSRKEVLMNRQIWWIIFIALPFVLYLYNPRITRDMLWYLRRFITVIIPFIYIVGALGIAQWHRQYPKIVRGLLIAFMSVQGFIVFHIVEHSTDQRKFYAQLDEFFQDTIDVIDGVTVQVVGDISLPNEATRILPYWIYADTELELQTITMEEIGAKEDPGKYLVFTEELSRDDLELIGVFRDTILVRNPQWNPRLPILRPTEKPIQLYVYAYQK